MAGKSSYTGLSAEIITAMTQTKRLKRSRRRKGITTLKMQLDAEMLDQEIRGRPSSFDVSRNRECLELAKLRPDPTTQLSVFVSIGLVTSEADVWEDHLALSFSLFRQRLCHTLPRASCTLDDFYVEYIMASLADGLSLLLRKKDDDQIVMAKVYDKERLVSRGTASIIKRERDFLYSLNHPFILPLLEFFIDNSYVYLITPYLNAGDLFIQMGTKCGKLTEGVSKFFIAQVVLAIEYLHYVGLVHREIKPENILVDQNGYIQLSDFTSCRLCEERCYTHCGTVDYIAPEVIEGLGYFQSVDWWSLGILMYDIITGYTPFGAITPMKVMAKIMEGKFTFPGNLSESFKDLVNGLLTRDVNRRLGCDRGAAEVKEHPWFELLDWEALYLREMVVSFRVEINELELDTGRSITIPIAPEDKETEAFKYWDTDYTYTSILETGSKRTNPYFTHRESLVREEIEAGLIDLGEARHAKRRTDPCEY